ncbi:SPOR domain-containing protein [Ferrimonas lipolytica]|uniref:SPOR domain-containing protein n=1 Tax=Ferrimonas lipolytica TaxID=2724191 RepID=A0A6H1UG33_9GAMM|nr:SPOR domain-containing protein [Ferrimonas lipolytica]QIZ77176.1 SPOR domain-containing protein [Ferrimonas lipolytica]
MASAFHNRLVGTVVLVAVAVLVLPEILDGEKATLEQQFATIPLRPSVEVVEVESVEPIQELTKPSWEIESDAEIAAAVQTVAKVEALKVDKKVAKATNTKPKSTSVKAGWSVRMGSFQNADNVKRLVAKLRQQKYPTYTIPAKPIDGALTVVFVGPEIDKQRVETLRTDLVKKMKMSGTVVAYDPLQL